MSVQNFRGQLLSTRKVIEIYPLLFYSIHSVHVNFFFWQIFCIWKESWFFAKVKISERFIDLAIFWQFKKSLWCGGVNVSLKTYFLFRLGPKYASFLLSIVYYYIRGSKFVVRNTRHGFRLSTNMYVWEIICMYGKF